MHIEFGHDVYSSDDKKLGTVVGLVMDAENQTVRGLVLGEGLFNQDERLVDISAVATSNDERVSLNMTDDAAAALPRFLKEEYIERPREAPDALIMPAAGVGGPIFYDSSVTASGYTDYPGNNSFFDPAPIDPPVVETRSNLDETEVILKKGTDVVGSDGEKVGTVNDIRFDNDGRLAGFVVKAGFLFTHDISIPASAVSEVDDNRVQLNITSEQAKGTS
ncbi:MAG: PRC-barrel domain-containing protein [Chloroflexia bacterium]|nr:PRC-barrel domain-containing protein [Chloroflexia bacterium]MDQ3410482.1 PRC-barrel domain-containing protein [Chloroflexota bacterium]